MSGKKVIHLGDYVIKEEWGDYSIVNAGMFEKTYELVEE